MLAILPILDVPFPCIAGLVAASVNEFKVLEKTRKLMNKWDLLKKLKGGLGIRSKAKKETVRAFMKGLDNNNSMRRVAVPSRQPSLRPNVSLRPQIPQVQDFDDPEIALQMEKVFKFCHVKIDAKFACAIPFWKQRTACKIAEGSYGEIYRFKHIDGTNRVFKCIPVEGQHPSCCHANIPLAMSLADVVSSKCLSDLNEGSVYLAANFPIIYSISLVRDRFPDLLMQSWWDYKSSPERLKDPAEHPRPDQYTEQQLYLTIESSFCGEPLTTKVLQNAWLGVSIMSQIVSALAVAEAAYNFEHRDLHFGNILVKHTDVASLKYTIHNLHFSVVTVGYHVFIIDFTLSRIYNDEKVYCVNLDELAERSLGYKEHVDSIWLDHSNMYKIMAEYSKGMWNSYMPITNIIWLKYLNENILEQLQKNITITTDLPLNDHNQREAIHLLRKWNDSILQHRSATDLLKEMILRDNPTVTVHA